MVRTWSHARNLREGRHSRPGHYYFLTTTTAARRSLFTNRSNAIIVVDALRWLRAANRFDVDAAVVMPDHVHLAGQLRTGTLAGTMHSLKSYTANRLSSSGACKSAWHRGYHDHCVRDDEDYRVRVRYLLENPVRAGLVEDVRDYRSSWERRA